MHRGAMAGEAEAAVERHDIDAESEQRAAIGIAAGIPAQIGELVALMLQPEANLPRCLFERFRHRRARLYRETQRQYVRSHTWDSPRGLTSRRHRQSDDDIFRAAETMKKYRRRRGHNPSECCPASSG